MDDVTNVLILQPTGQSYSLANLDAKHCFDLLERVSGDVGQFARLFSDNDPDVTRILFYAESIVKQDPHYYKQWRDAIRQNQVIRLRLLQDKALSGIETVFDRPDKTSELLTAAKTVLGDLFAGQIAMTRSAVPAVVVEAPKDDEEDDADLERAMSTY